MPIGVTIRMGAIVAAFAVLLILRVSMGLAAFHVTARAAALRKNVVELLAVQQGKPVSTALAVFRVMASVAALLETAVTMSVVQAQRISVAQRSLPERLCAAPLLRQIQTSLHVVEIYAVPHVAMTLTGPVDTLHQAVAAKRTPAAAIAATMEPVSTAFALEIILYLLYEEDMQVFITGIAGFIGFHTALALKRQGHFVTGCDNFNDYYDVSLKRERAAILAKEKIQVLELPVQEIDSLTYLFKKEEISHIIHLAAEAGIRYSIDHADLFVEDNLVAFIRVLEFCKTHPSIKLIYASSSSVYGMRNDSKFKENDNTDHPTSLYGATKKCDEVLAYDYHHCFKISTIGLRFFTVYGPWGRPDMAVDLFIKHIDEGKPITLYAPEKMERDFTYIDDIVDGIIASLSLSGYHLINLGDSKRSPLLQLVHLIEENLGKKATVQTAPAPLGDVYITSADITLAKTLLHYTPKVDLPEGIKRSVDWYRHWRSSHT